MKYLVLILALFLAGCGSTLPKTVYEEYTVTIFSSTVDNQTFRFNNVTFQKQSKYNSLGFTESPWFIKEHSITKPWKISSNLPFTYQVHKGLKLIQDTRESYYDENLGTYYRYYIPILI